MKATNLLAAAVLGDPNLYCLLFLQEEGAKFRLWWDRWVSRHQDLSPEALVQHTAKVIERLSRCGYRPGKAGWEWLNPKREQAAPHEDMKVPETFVTYGVAGACNVLLKQPGAMVRMRRNRSLKFLNGRHTVREIRQRLARWMGLRVERESEAIKASRLAFVNQHKGTVRTMRARLVWKGANARRPIGAHPPKKLSTFNVVGYRPMADRWDTPPGIPLEAFEKELRRLEREKTARLKDGVKVWQDASPGPVNKKLQWSGAFAVLPSGLIVDPEHAPEEAITVQSKDMVRAAWFYARRLYKHHLASLNRFDRTRNVADIVDLILGLPVEGGKRGGGAWVAHARAEGFALQPKGWIEDFRRGRELRPEDRGFILALRILYPNMGVARKIVTEGLGLAKYIADPRVKLVQYDADGNVKLNEKGLTVYNMVRLADLPMQEKDGLLVPHPKVDEWFKRFDRRKKKIRWWQGQAKDAPLRNLGSGLETDPSKFRSTARDLQPSVAAEMKESRYLLSVGRIDTTKFSLEDWIWLRRLYLSGRKSLNNQDRGRLTFLIELAAKKDRKRLREAFAV